MMSLFFDGFCLGSMSEHSADPQRTTGNEGQGQLGEFPELRIGSTGPKTSWRGAKVPVTAVPDA